MSGEALLRYLKGRPTNMSIASLKELVVGLKYRIN